MARLNDRLRGIHFHPDQEEPLTRDEMKKIRRFNLVWFAHALLFRHPHVRPV